MAVCFLQLASALGAAEPALVRLAVSEGRDIRFAHLTTKDGLSFGQIRDIVQDDQGFLWFNASNVLNRYDGCRFKSEPPDFRVIAEGARQPLSPLLQDEVYRIGREILRNAFHHARASHIEAEIVYDSQLFRLRIRDEAELTVPARIAYATALRRQRLRPVRGRKVES
jgi:ligand-binding sensor domain-containing protein